MSTFCAQDQSKIGLLFAPFGYLVRTSALQFIQPADAMEVTSTTRSSVMKVKFDRIFYDNHLFTLPSEIDCIINIDYLNICSFVISLSCNCSIYKIFLDLAKVSPPAENLGQSVLVNLSYIQILYMISLENEVYR